MNGEPQTAESQSGVPLTMPLTELTLATENEEHNDGLHEESNKSESESSTKSARSGDKVQQEQSKSKVESTTPKATPKKKENKSWIPLTLGTKVEPKQPKPPEPSKTAKSRALSITASKMSTFSTKSKKAVPKVPEKQVVPKVPKVEKRKRSLSKLRSSDASIFSFHNLAGTSTHNLSNRSSNLSRTSRSKERSVQSKESAVNMPKSGIWAAKKKVHTPQAVKKPKEFTNMLLDSSVEDSESGDTTDQEAEDSIRVDEVYQRNALMDLLKELPDINDISETSSVGPAAAAKQKEKKDKDKERERYELEGRFVEKVSFDSHTASPSSEVAPVEEIIEEENTMPKVSEESSYVSSLSFSDSDSGSIMELRSLKSVAREDITVKMTTITLRDSNTVLFDYADSDALDRQQMVSDICELFLDDLIQKVVQYCNEDSVRLQRVLDKKKLMAALIPLSEQFVAEKLYKEKLQQLIRDYYIRKKQFGFVTQSQFDSVNSQRYRGSLVELDRLLELQEATVAKSQAQSAKLREEAENARMHAEQKVADLEQSVRETCIRREHFDHLRIAVNNVLKSMSRVRDELSEMRLELINAQHRLADIEKKSEALESLGEGLYMREYLSNQTEVQALSAKIADRTNDLNRLHFKINFDVHALAHLKCKEQMCRKTLNLLRTQLMASEDSSLKLRDHIYQGKLKHTRLRKELLKIKASGSLIYYPDLVKDYDITFKALQAKRETVEKLRATQSRLTQRLAQAEAYLIASSRKDSIRSIRVIPTITKQDAIPQTELTITKLLS